MAYSKTTWKKGDKITAQKMNNIENGIEEAASGGTSTGFLIIEDEYPPNDDTIRLNKTFAQIFEALDSGIPVFLHKVAHQNNQNGLDTYQASRKVCPVIQAYKYAGDYRIIVEDSVGVGTVNGVSGTKGNALAIFTADDPQEKPVWRLNIVSDWSEGKTHYSNNTANYA